MLMSVLKILMAVITIVLTLWDPTSATAKLDMNYMIT